MFPGIKSYRGHCPVGICRCPDRPAERQILVLADICAVINPVLKYCSQRDAARTGDRRVDQRPQYPSRDQIGYDADPVDVTWLVQNALDRNALVADGDVSVDISGNTGAWLVLIRPPPIT
jgi:hypothetical protein